MTHIRLRTSFLTLAFSVSLVMGCQSDNTGSEIAPAKTDEVAEDPLPSWNEVDSKQQIIEYVNAVTNESGPDYIEPADRIATFDNDGTLWSEQPVYFQLFFAIDRVKATSGDHPEWKVQQPFKAILENDMEALASQGIPALMKIMMATHAEVTTSDFESIVTTWIDTAQHPIRNKAFTELVYQPMLELMDYLRSNGFKVFIVSGGGVDFMRAWAEEVYGVPKHQIIGSRIKSEYDWNYGNPVIRKLPELGMIDDKEGKPVGINDHIGRKPVIAVGNSDGDLQMLRWADSNEKRSLQIYLHHTDSVREWKYDRASHIGTFDKGLDEALDKGWNIIDMKNDWKVIYPYELNNNQ